MYRFKVFLFTICLTGVSLFGRTQTAAQLHETARTFMRSGDYANAVLVLNRAILLDPKNIEISKDLGLNYYFAKDYTKALEICKLLFDKDGVDDQLY
ncbi:MAG TPA: tetratricopeptide repeat protein [Ferruginibacter sp.]|nr:tetratricopeptide repeat protein [Ferruginibacter sp.]